MPLPVQVLEVLNRHQIAMKALDLAHPQGFGVCDAKAIEEISAISRH